MAMKEEEEEQIVILGAGIVGAATAFYLACAHDGGSSKRRVHLVDAGKVAGGASGKAGGFLARDWHGARSASLAALSFDLHAQLAAEYDGEQRWGYARTRAFSIAPRPGQAKNWITTGASRSSAAARARKTDALPPWLRVDGVADAQLVGDGATTAQVDPYLLTHFLADEAVRRGVELHEDTRPLSVDGGRRILHCTTGCQLPYTKLLIAAGPWSASLHAMLFPCSPRLPVGSLAGHSLVVTTRQSTPEPCALFASHTKFSPEIFSRTNGEIYIAGLNSAQLPLPTSTSAVVPLQEELAVLHEVAKTLVGEFEVVRTQLCFRPITDKELLLDELGEGVYVCTGAGPWGITLGPGCGRCCADLLMGRTSSADVSQLGLD